MTFLNPLVLLGLAAAAIPLIIHFFNFRRPRRIAYSSLTFLKELRSTTMQRVRIKQWLLLLLRTLAIASLIMAFARPTIHAGIGGVFAAQGRSSIALVLDNSLSMTLRNAGGAYFDQARELALGLLERLQEDDEVFVLSGAAEQPERAVEAVAAAEVTPKTVTAAEALVRAADLLESTAAHPNRAIYYIGDLQRSTLLDSLAAVAVGDTRVTLLPIGGRKHVNVAVTDVRVTSRVVEKGEPVHVEATIVSYASDPLQGYVASLFLEGERLAQATLDLFPGVPTRASFVVTPQHRGWLSGRVHIEDDAFPQDNTHWFTLHVPEERNILVVHGPGEDASYIELALQSGISRDRGLFTKRSLDESQLAATPLGAYDAVVLLGLESLSSGEIASLTRYVEGGGGLLVFPGRGPDVEHMNALLRELGGGSIRGFTGEAGSGSAIATLDRVDLEHPLFEGVFELAHQREIERPEVYYAIDYLPASVSEYTLMHLSNGAPFLQELRKGRGTAFLLAAPPDVNWTDLPLRGLFIPLLHRSIYYLSATESVQGEQLRAGEPADLRLAGVAGGPIVRIISPTGVEVTPEQRSLFGAVLVQIGEAFTQPGIYDVRADEDLLRRLALNVDSRESDLATASPEQAADTLAAATGLPVRAMQSEPGEPQTLLAAILADRTGVEVWHVFLWITLFCLVAEMFVSMRWRNRSAADHGKPPGNGPQSV